MNASNTIVSHNCTDFIHLPIGAHVNKAITNHIYFDGWRQNDGDFGDGLWLLYPHSGIWTSRLRFYACSWSYAWELDNWGFIPSKSVLQTNNHQKKQCFSWIYHQESVPSTSLQPQKKTMLTFWLFDIAIDSDPFIDDSWIMMIYSTLR